MATTQKEERTVTYASGRDTDMEGGTPVRVSPSEGRLLPPSFMTFDEVQDRLVEAMLTCWRYPDRERGWQRLRSAWPEISRDVLAGDYDARGGDGTSSDVSLRPASQTRAEIAEMEEAFGWLDAITPADRKLVGLAIRELARGRREVSWVRLLAAMGLERGVEGLRKRYTRSLTAICNAVNGGNPRADVSTRSIRAA